MAVLQGQNINVWISEDIERSRTPKNEEEELNMLVSATRGWYRPSPDTKIFIIHYAYKTLCDRKSAFADSVSRKEEEEALRATEQSRRDEKMQHEQRIDAMRSNF